MARYDTLSTQEIEISLENHVLQITLDRPSKLNAMTVAMDTVMNQLAYEINNDDEVRCVILTGRGGKAFSAGSDITDLDEYGDHWSYRNRFDARKDYARAIWLMRKPIIAAIDGYCIGGGLEMACGADIRLCTPLSSFGAGEIVWGWHGGSGQTQFLTHLVGAGWASRLLLTGERIDGAEAQRIGLVQHVLEPVEMLEEANRIAHRIASLSPIAVQRTKGMVRVAHNVPLDAALLVENDSFSACMATEDALEGQKAFAQKRVPIFKGR
jgi:enoyl-CoA hydratase/carnithine racemase